MKALLQRVKKASVSIDGQTFGSIGYGLVIFVGVAVNDTESDARHLVNKISNLRIFSDDSGKFNRSAIDTGADMLVVSQFTLLADTVKGRRPSFTEAASPTYAESLVNKFIEMLRQTRLKVETGQFQRHMQVDICNDGPVTIMLESKEKRD